MVNHYGVQAFSWDQSIDICSKIDTTTHYYQLFYQKWIMNSPYTSLMSVFAPLVPFNSMRRALKYTYVPDNKNEFGLKHKEDKPLRSDNSTLYLKI